MKRAGLGGRMGAHLILEGEELLVVWNLLGEGVRRVYFLWKKKGVPCSLRIGTR